MTPENRQSGMEPLVWYLANKGEDWRVYGAYLEERDGDSGPNYRILELWAGNITYEDKALGLLLIIDYIFDWARDVYRREIISNLLSLATNSTPSLAADTDVYSTTDQLFMKDQAQDLNIPISPNQDKQFDVLDMLRFFDKGHLALRDASYIHRDLCGLHITDDNLKKLLSSANHPREAKQLARRIWRAIASPETWSVSAACLNDVEELWTGKSREHETFQIPDQRFFVIFFVRYYLKEGLDTPFRPHLNERPGQWEQHHELTYIAVAEDALDALREQTGFQPQFFRLDLQSCPRVSPDWIIGAFRKHRNAPTRHCLLRAVCRYTYQSSSRRASPHKDTNCFPAHEESYFRRHIAYFHPSIYLPPPGQQHSHISIGLPWLIYKRLKVGMSEPSESFLRVSQLVGKHELRTKKIVKSKTPTKQRIDLKDANVVVVTEDGPSHKDQQLPSQCIFLLDVPDMRSETGEVGKKMKVFPQALCTTFPARGTPNRNLWKDITRRWDIEMFTEFLEHVSTEYLLSVSLEPGTSTGELPGWIWWRYQDLSRELKSKWHYSSNETIEGIKDSGESYNFGQLLQNLGVAFQKAREDRAAMERAKEARNADIKEKRRTQRSVSPSHIHKKFDIRKIPRKGSMPAGLAFTDRPAIQSGLSDCASASRTESKRKLVIDLSDSSTESKRSASVLSEDEDAETPVFKRARLD